MTVDQITYLTFGLVLVVALVLDLGLMSKKNTAVSMKKALYQTLFWVLLSIAFCIFLWLEKSSIVATKYYTAYLMEWSLSIYNIFVFILIFSFFKVNQNDAGRALLIGILLAIVFRIIFIALGIELINRFHWIISVVVLMLAAVDIAFALDSIPTVVSLVREKANADFTADDILVIYSSNIFAVLGLRSLFFLLKGAVDKFDYLQQGIAIVLVFIGIKMLVEYFGIHINILISLGVIVACLVGSVVYSMKYPRPKPHQLEK